MPQQHARPKSLLNRNLEKNITTYMLSATTAGIGLFSLAQPSQAEIIYTPANITIVENKGEIGLDVDNDGLPDFQFSNFFSQAVPLPPLGFHIAQLDVRPARKANRVEFVQSQATNCQVKNANCAAELNKGAAIDRQSPVQPGYSQLVMAESGGSAYSTFFVGPWFGQSQHQGFLGLRFTINGQNHFGWARLTIQGVNSATITGYAYEDVANMPIRAGRTSGTEDNYGASEGNSLGHLAQGAGTTN